MRLIDAEALDKARIDYIVSGYANDPEDCAEFGKMIIKAPTVCDIDAIRKRIRYEANVFDTTKGFAYCSGWMDALKFALDIIDKHMKGEKE